MQLQTRMFRCRVPAAGTRDHETNQPESNRRDDTLSLAVSRARSHLQGFVALSIFALISFLSLAPSLRALPFFISGKPCCVKHACCAKHSNRAEWRAAQGCAEGCGCDAAIPGAAAGIVGARINAPALLTQTNVSRDWVRFNRFLSFHRNDSPRPPPSLC